jgi:hypothetical protein
MLSQEDISPTIPPIRTSGQLLPLLGESRTCGPLTPAKADGALSTTKFERGVKMFTELGGGFQENSIA